MELQYSEDNVVNFRINEYSPKIEQPENIKITLKPHQLSCLYRMKQLDSNCEFTHGNYNIKSNIGFLGDIPGSGKTMTALALIEINRDINKKSLPMIKMSAGRYYGTITEILNVNNEPPSTGTLIVVPNNLVNHWSKHIKEFTNLSFEIVKESQISKISPELLDIILCPSKYYNKFVSYHNDNDLVWDRVIFDEIDSINIPNTIFVHSRFLWFITSTYLNIHKRKNNGFIKDMFYDFSRRGMNIIKKFHLKTVIECEESFVKASFNLEEPLQEIIHCDMPEHFKIIKNFVTDSVLEKISAGDIDSAILELGGTVDSPNNIIDLLTKQIKNNIVKLETEINCINLLELQQSEKDIQIKNLNEKLEKLKTRQDSLIESIKTASKTDCAICCQTLESPTLVNCCKNLYCTNCLVTWMQISDKCPLCRENLNSKLFIKIGDTKKTPIIKRTKIEAMKEIISMNPNGKFLIFSDYGLTFNKISKELSDSGISNNYVSRDSPVKTERVLKNFKEGYLKVLLLDSKNNGAGLEIPEATDVILFHKMEPHLELQTIGRAQRPGRESKLKIWKLRFPIEN